MIIFEYKLKNFDLFNFFVVVIFENDLKSLNKFWKVIVVIIFLFVEIFIFFFVLIVW